MVSNIGNGKGDTNFISGFAEGVAAAALIELTKDLIANKYYQAAFRRLQDATQAKPTADARRQVNNMIKQLLPNPNTKDR